MHQDLTGITCLALLSKSLEYTRGHLGSLPGTGLPWEGVHQGWQEPLLLQERQQQPGAGIYFSFLPLCSSVATGGKFRSSHHPRQRY